MEQKLHQMARYYMMAMSQRHPRVDPYDYSLDEFLDKYTSTLSIVDIYLGQSIVNMFDITDGLKVENNTMTYNTLMEWDKNDLSEYILDLFHDVYKYKQRIKLLETKVAKLRDKVGSE